MNNVSKEILLKMNISKSLVEFCEYLEIKTNGIFTFSTLIFHLSIFYKDILEEKEIKYLIKNIPLDSLKISLDNPYIRLTNLYNYFSKILNIIILSPILILQNIADYFDKNIIKKTRDFFNEKKIDTQSEINIIEFIKFVSENLYLDDVTSLILFKILDHHKKGLIILDEFIIVIDSYREYNQDDNIISKNLSPEIISAELFKLIIDKNFINLKELFNNESISLKNLIKKIKSKIKNKDEENLVNTILNNFLSYIVHINDNNSDNFSYDLIIKYLPETKSSNIHQKIYLNQFQINSLDKYLKILKENDLNSETILNFNTNSFSQNISLNNLKESILNNTTKNVNINDVDNIIKSFNINQSNIITREQYENLINYMNENSLNNKKNNLLKQMNNNINTNNYFLLPVKGNMKILKKYQREIDRIISINNILQKPQTIEIESTIEQSNEQSENNKLNDISVAKTETNINQSLYQEMNSKSNLLDITLNSLLNNENFIINSLESINFPKKYITSYDLLYHLSSLNTNHNISKKALSKIIKNIDKDNDGYISAKDIQKFFKKKLNYDSSIIAYKIIKNKINFEYQKTVEDYFLLNYDGNQKLLDDIELYLFLNEKFNISKELSEKIFYDMNSQYSPPISIRTLIDIIDKQNIEKDENDILSEITIGFNLKNLDINNFETEIKEIVDNLIEVNNAIDEEEDYIYNENIYKLNINALKENLISVLKIPKEKDLNEIEYSFDEFKENIIKPLHMSLNLGTIIFNILKQFNEEKEIYVVYLRDIINLFIGFIQPNIENKNCEEIYECMQKTGIYLNYPLDKVSFNSNGVVSVFEIKTLLNLYYPFINNNYIKKIIIEEINYKKNGFLTYNEIQKFLIKNNLNPINNFSYIIELKNIMSELIKNKLIKNKSEEYLYKDNNEIIKDYSNIKYNDHKYLFKNICTSKNILKEFFNYILTKQGKIEGYNIQLLAEDLNYFSEYDDNNTLKDYNYLIQFLPEISLVEDIINNININENLIISIFELTKNISNKEIKINFAKAIDENKQGFIDLKNLIKKLRDLYGNYLKLNIKLVQKYINIKHNFNSEDKNEYFKNIENYILSKVNEKNKYLKNIYLNKNDCYLKFSEDFFDDEVIFEKFYQIYKEKSGNNINQLNLGNYFKFISGENYVPQKNNNTNNKDDLNNNKNEISNKNNNEQNEMILLKNKLNPINKNNISNLSNKSNNSSKLNKSISIDASKKNIFNNEQKNTLNTNSSNNKPYYNLLISYETEELPIKNVINMISKDYDLDNNITINEIFLQNLFEQKLNFNDEDIKLIIKKFRYNIYENKFDLKKFVFYIEENISQKKFDLNTDFIEKVKKVIYKSNTTNFRSFINKEFKGKYQFNFLEFYESFNKLNINLYDLILTFPTESNIFNITKFFKKNGLMNLFTTESFEPSMKKSLKKLNDYLKQRKNRDSLFKKFDLDRNGTLQINEFKKIILSCKDINLSDEQVNNIIQVADNNKDGVIDPAEFINFLDTLNETEQLEFKNKTSNLLYNNNDKPPQPFESKFLFDLTDIKKNLLDNMNYLKQNKNDNFLNYITLLQNDLIRNYNNTNSLEFLLVNNDLNKNGKIKKDAFQSILKQKLLSIEENALQQFILLCEKNLFPDVKANLFMKGLVDYNNFLKNLIQYNILKIQ